MEGQEAQGVRGEGGRGVAGKGLDKLVCEEVHIGEAEVEKLLSSTISHPL